MKRLSGSEDFKNTGDKHFSVQEYWGYNYSNLNSNFVRGAIAEFIVLNALKENTESEAHDVANDFDFMYNGSKVEVKCSTYIQNWGEERRTPISWVSLKADDLYARPKTKLGPDGTIAYPADIYVLALLMHKDYASLDVMDLQQWCFYVLTRERLREISNNRNNLPIHKLEKHGVIPVSFASLRIAVDACLNEDAKTSSQEK